MYPYINHINIQFLSNHKLTFGNIIFNLRHNSISPGQILLGVPDLPIICHKVLLSLEVLHEADGAVQPLLGAVNPAPGLAGEVGHVVHCAVGTKLAKLFTFVANVIQLTLSLKVSIIPKKIIMGKI